MFTPENNDNTRIALIGLLREQQALLLNAEGFNYNDTQAIRSEYKAYRGGIDTMLTAEERTALNTVLDKNFVTYEDFKYTLQYEVESYEIDLTIYFIRLDKLIEKYER